MIQWLKIIKGGIEMNCEKFKEVEEVRINFLLSGLSIESEKVSDDELLAIAHCAIEYIDVSEKCLNCKTNCVFKGNHVSEKELETMAWKLYFMLLFI